MTMPFYWSKHKYIRKEEKLIWKGNNKFVLYNVFHLLHLISSMHCFKYNIISWWVLCALSADQWGSFGSSRPSVLSRLPVLPVYKCHDCYLPSPPLPPPPIVVPPPPSDTCIRIPRPKQYCRR